MDVVDRQFSDPEQAQLYDRLAPPEARDDFRFYLPLVMSANAVLDVGCGTGALLRMARQAGHAGRLVGLDPADGMLQQARTRRDIEWVLGDLTMVDWEQEFDLVVMTGHAFQVLLSDQQLRTSLAAIRAALVDAGRFAFETRHPQAREWERWTPDRIVQFTDEAGRIVRHQSAVETVTGDLVSFTTTYSSDSWDRPKVSHSTLRFLDADALSRFLAEAGLVIEAHFGDWDRQPVTERSPEIITIARRDGADRAGVATSDGSPWREAAS